MFLAVLWYFFLFEKFSKLIFFHLPVGVSSQKKNIFC